MGHPDCMVQLSTRQAQVLVVVQLAAVSATGFHPMVEMLVLVTVHSWT
jgi:hypothetical protein